MAQFKLIFVGTAEIGTPLLKALHEDPRFEVVTAITQQDRPAGRGMEMTGSPVKILAESLGIPVYQPENINAPESLEQIKAYEANAIVLFAYGQILKKELLDLIPCINVHGSLLPKYRGASPIQSVILNKEVETGISLMHMVEKMDAGPVYEQFKIPIIGSDTAQTIHDKLGMEAGKQIPNALFSVLAEDKKAQPQMDNFASYCAKIQKSDGEINWDADSENILLLIRALAGWPGTYTFFNGKRLKIIEATSSGQTSHLAPGHTFQYNNEVLISTQTGSVKPITVQLEGKSPMPISEFIKGNEDFINTELGETA